MKIISSFRLIFFGKFQTAGFILDFLFAINPLVSKTGFVQSGKIRGEKGGKGESEESQRKSVKNRRKQGTFLVVWRKFCFPV